MKALQKAIGIFAGMLVLTALACGGSNPTSNPTKAPEQPTQEPNQEPTAKPVSSSAVTSLEDVRNAVVYIETVGDFAYPEDGGGTRLEGYTGTGFMIDPTGIIVTNNHVVAGASLVKVYLDGSSEALNARVLGTSECSDLAVLDIAGDELPYLNWYEGDVKVGLDAYTAGFPLGDPEFTLTKGIVAKEKADGNSSWAAVDSVIMHDATINPGNSGGPLITKDGEVIAVNYAGNSETNQYFAIGQRTALPVIEKLQNGEDVDALGINGEAIVVSEELSGIWVYSVEAGSPADKARIEGGDFIISLTGIPVGTDGTMSAYCDVVRSNASGDVIDIQVYRPATDEILEGQINGRELEFVSNGSNGGGDSANNSGDATPAASGDEFVVVTDDAESISVKIPAGSEYDGSAWTLSDGDVIGAQITAAPSLDDYYNNWDAPGFFFGVSDDLAKLGGYIQLLDIYRDIYREDCQYDNRYDYDDGYYEGKYDSFYACGGTDGNLFVLSARPKSNPTGALITVQMQYIEDSDLDVLKQILDTFDIIGTLPR
ncbi:MAG TPA: trypsin-like peptidase domain-containing protein [Anaerolineales bacterium]|nr:trypsin-like peptidase domain-containing protein [Anaerolineales bacterium]